MSLILVIVDYFKEFSIYNKYIDKPIIKCLNNIDLLSELPFYEELNIIKTNHAFRGYTMNYKVELVKKKGLITKLEVCKSSIKDLLSDFLNETKGFKYQITLIVTLKNTNQMEKLNLLQFISVRQQNQ